MILGLKYRCVFRYIAYIGLTLPGYSSPLNSEKPALQNTVNVNAVSGNKSFEILFASNPEAIDVRNFRIQNISTRSQILPLIGRDPDGTITGFRILSLPAVASGRLYLNNVLVVVNQLLTTTQAKQFQFEVLSSFTGNATFTYTVIDNDLLTDLSPATFTIPVVNTSAQMICIGGSLGVNILGNAGTFSAPYIVPVATLSCINNGAAGSVNPPQNLGQAHPELTNYTYASTSGGLGPEGRYSFLKTIGAVAPGNCIKGDWRASDRTGDGGYFMAINGSPNESTFGKTFYDSKNLQVCPNTLYEFSAYVINLLPGNSPSANPGISEPNISFYINNQLVSTSGAIAYSNASTSFTPQWVKVGGLWYSGANTSVDLRIDNATFVAAGNDLGLDDISMAICGPEITYPNNDLNPKFCAPGILPLSAQVKSSINTYSYYIFEINKNDGFGWTQLSAQVQTGSPEVIADGSYSYIAAHGNIPVDFSMNGYQFRVKVATDPGNLTGETCNIAATTVISVAAIEYPNAGNDVYDCTGIVSYKLIAAKSGEIWTAVAGNPAAATIDQSGQINGMTVNGEYKFVLKNSIGCEDFVSIFRYKINDLPITQATICSAQDTYTLPVPNAGYTWLAQPGNPSIVLINQADGNVTGITASGIYQFLLRSDFSTCTADFTITKAEPVVISVISTVDICAGSTFDLTKAINNFNEITNTYLITDQVGNIISAPYIVSTAGDYKVIIGTTGQPCKSETATIKIIVRPKPGSPLIKLIIN